MRGSKYEVLDRSIGQFRCISIKDVSPITKKVEYEDTLAGERGEIWVVGGSTCKAFVALPGKDEKIISFDIKDLKKWFHKLKVPFRPEEQLLWGNNPNSR